MKKKAMEGFTLFQPAPNDPKEPRGAFDRLRKVIALGKNADLSTILHEMAHSWLEEVGEDYAYIKSNNQTGVLTDEQAKFIRESDAMLKWLGVESFAEIETKHHEKFARGAELYFMEGKAPSPGMKDVFEKFKGWMFSIYRNIKGELNEAGKAHFEGVELNDEVREFFDSLLASDEQVAAAEAAIGARSLFADPATAQTLGLNEETAQRWASADEDATRASQQALEAQMFNEMNRKRGKEYKEKRDAIQLEIEQEVNSRRGYIALAVLQTGKLPDGSEIADPQTGGSAKALAAIKISRQSIVEELGEERLKTLPKPYIYSKENGVPLDVAAAMFGYSSGDEMLQELEKLPKRKEEIQRLTDERMRAENPSLLETGAIGPEALKAAHNDKRAELIAKELKFIAENDFPTLKSMVKKFSRPIPTTKSVREQAQKVIARKAPREINPLLYQRAEQRAAKEAVDLLLKGDREGAFAAKQRQLFNHELYRAAIAAREEVAKLADYMNGFNSTSVRERLGKAGYEYLNQIDAIRERFDFRKGVSLKNLDKRKSLRDFVKEAEAQGLAVDIPESVLNEANRVSYKEMPLEDLRALKDTVEQIWHLAKLKNELLENKDARELQEVEDELVATIEANHKGGKGPEDITPDLKQKLAKGVSKLFASHTRMEFLFEFLDGMKAHGAFWRHLFRPFVEAENKEMEFAKRDTEALHKIFSVVPRKVRAKWFTQKFFIEGLKNDKHTGTVTKAELLCMALNWGNQYNREALMEGYGWDEAQVVDALNRLSAEEIGIVNQVWAYINTYWGEASALQKEITGIAPQKVEGSAYALQNGRLDGGYYPIKFDSDRSYRQFQLDEKAELGESFAHATRAMTRHGHLIERQGTGGKPLLLNLSVMTGHLAQVRHDITHRRAIIDVSRIINRTRVREAIEAAAGKDMYRQLAPWLKGIAGDTPPEVSDGWEGLLSHVRSGATVVNLGLKATSGIVQALGFLNTVDEVGLRYAFKKVNPFKAKEYWDFVKERSPMMANRLENYDRDVRDYVRKQDVITDADKAWFYHIGFMDLMLSVPTWLGAYQKAMDGHMENIEKGDEKAAIEYADSVVRKTMAAGAAKDLAQVQRGNELKRLFTAFYSQLSIQFNLMQRAGKKFGMTKDIAALASSAAVLWFLPAVLQEVIRGRGPDDDDDEEEKLKWLLRKEMAYPFQSIILARDIVNAAEFAAESGRRANFTPSPAFQAFGTIIDSAVSASKVVGDDEFKRQDLKNMVIASGYVFKWPSRQAWITGEYLYDWMAGEVSPSNPVEAFWRALVTGKPKE
jgi:hypothetical protein